MGVDWGLAAVGSALEAMAQLGAECEQLSGRLRIIAAICRDEPDRDRALRAVAAVAERSLHREGLTAEACRQIAQHALAETKRSTP